MDSIATTFSAVGSSAQMHIKKDETLLYKFDVLASWDGTVILEKSRDQQTWELVATFTTTDDNGALLVATEDTNYRFTCTVFTAGTATATLSNLSTAVVASQNAGTTVSGVTATEQGNGILHRTILRIEDLSVSVVSVTTGNGVGGTKVYDFPQGRLLVLGTMADLSVSIASGDQADFTDATPEGDFGVGTVAPANADALGTDATDDDFSTATAFTMAAYTGNVQCPSEAALQFDGTSTAIDMYINALVDAADIDDDTTSTLSVSGSIVITWINLGDF